METKIAMINASSLALDYKKAKPSADIEEIIQNIIHKLNPPSQAKLASIAAITRTIKYRQENSALSDKQITQKIMDESNEIISSTEEE